MDHCPICETSELNTILLPKPERRYLHCPVCGFVHLAGSSHLSPADERGRYMEHQNRINACLLYTSPSPRDRTRSRMPSSA